MRLLEILSDFAPAQLSSGQIKCRCPFTHLHSSDSQKRKQMFLTPDKNLYHCFSCGSAGTLTSLLTTKFGISLYEAIDLVNFEAIDVEVLTDYDKPNIFAPKMPEFYASHLLSYSKPPEEFLDRGFTLKLLKRFGVGLNVVEHEKLGEIEVITFPLIQANKLVGVKYRGIGEHSRVFWYSKGFSKEQFLYNFDEVKKLGRTGIIVEGECFDGDAEVLTVNGWMKLKDYPSDCSIRIAEVSEDLMISFVNPYRFVKKFYKDNMIELSSKGYYSFTTKKHNIISYNKRHSDLTLEKRFAMDGFPSNYLIPRVGFLSGKGVGLSKNKIALHIAASADGTFDKRKDGSTYIRFSGLKKERKIKHLEEILAALKIAYHKGENSNGSYNICFTDPGLHLSRMFNIKWLAFMSLEEREFFIEELSLWDGNKVKTRNQSEYASKYYENALFVQTLAHTMGRVSSIIKRKNSLGKWFKVSILHGKSNSSWQAIKRREVPYEDFVYCASVPSGALLVRQNEKITVTGNTDTFQCVKNGEERVFASLGGELSEMQVSLIQDNLDTLYIAYDNDEAGFLFKEKAYHKLKHSVKLLFVPYNASDPGSCSKVNWDLGMLAADDYATYSLEMFRLLGEEYEKIQDKAIRQLKKSGWL